MSELPITEKTGCDCGHDADGSIPELDARLIPHQVRHAAVIGAFASLPPEGAMVIVTPHKPLGVLNELAGQFGDGVAISFLESEDGFKTLLTRA